MAIQRPLGIKLISWILFVEALVLLASAAAAYFWPAQSPEVVGFILHRLPYFRNLPIAEGGSASVLPSVFALLFALWAATKGFGMWFMQGWVRMLIMVDLAGRFASLFMFMGVSGSKEILALASDPDFVIASVINVLVLLYLFDDGVAKLFDRERYESRHWGAGWSDRE